MDIKGVSVIIPTYNREKVIARAIESVIDQSYSKLEIIIIDDNSTDNTEEIVKKITDRRIVYKKLDRRRGPAYARNMGVKLAAYDLIAFQDSDDVWMQDKLEMQIKYMEENKDFDMVYCAFMHGGERNYKVPSNKHSKSHLEGEIYKELLRENKIGTPTMLVKKQVFEQVGGFNIDIHAYEDWEFAIRVAKEHKIGYVDKILVEAYSSNDGVNSNEKNKADTLFYILEKYGERNAVDYIKKILIYVSGVEDPEELLDWKDKLIPKYISTESDFDIMMSILHMGTEEKDNNELIMKLGDDAFAADRLRSLKILKNETIIIYGVTNIGNCLYRLLKKMGYNKVLYTDSNLVRLKDYLITPLTELPQDIDYVITTFGKNIDNSFIGEKLKAREIVSVYSLFL